MPLELSDGQIDLAHRLSEHAKGACSLVDLKCQKVEPKHFYLTVFRFYGRVQGMTAEMERCIDWCIGRNKQVFTAQRFGNWCKNQVKFAKEKEINTNELNKLKNGTGYQRAEYSRRQEQIREAQHRREGGRRKEDTSETHDASY